MHTIVQQHMNIDPAEPIRSWLGVYHKVQPSDAIHIGHARALFERLASYGEHERTCTLAYLIKMGCPDLLALWQWTEWCLLHRSAPVGGVDELRDWLFAPYALKR